MLPALCSDQALDHHTKEEEDEMLAELAMRVDRDMLEQLSDKFQAAKKRVPTRYDFNRTGCQH